MTIKEKLLAKQPEVYLKLLKLKKELSPQEITERDIRECMSHGAWKRTKGGAIKQVRW